MTITRSGVLLAVLYLAAVWVRTHHAETRYPYFNGESATRFRIAASVAADGHLPDTDQRVFVPDGFAPVEAGPVGVEYVTGQLYRIVSRFSDMSPVQFARLLVILVFALTVFAGYAITRTLWSCTAAGFFTAFLVAFYPPLVFASDGRDFLHGPFAATVAAFGIAGLVRWLRRPSPGAAITAALATFALHAAWEHTGYFAALVAVVVLLSRPERVAGAAMIVAQLLAVLSAGILFPHLRAGHYLASWPAILVLACAARFVAGNRLPRRLQPASYAAIAAVFAIVVARVAAGDETMPSLGEYWLARLRFIAGKPDDPMMLTPALRTLWAYRSAPPGWYGVVTFFLPWLLLAPATVMGIRRFRAAAGSHTTGSTEGAVAPVGRTWAVVIVGALGVVAFLIDHSAVLIAPLCVLPLASAAFFGFRGQWRARVLPVVLAVAVMGAELAAPFGRLNPGYRLASALRGSEGTDDGFLWVSIGNADLELVRHLVSRTSVGDVFLAPPRIASLMVQFAGRKLVLVPGAGTVAAAQRTSELMRLYYENEDTLYERCRALGITHIVYSVDVLLDTSKYSNRYLAGLGYTPEGGAVWDMHFKPERLHHFTLAYENDNYRVFRVTKESEPFFLTDHPPVYQRRIMETHGDSLDEFHRRIVDVLLTYSTARELQEAGDDEAAIRRFRYCVTQAPEFTRGWLGVGDSALRLGELKTAGSAYVRVLQVAPDNAHALYFGAVSVSRLGDRGQALKMLAVLLNSTDNTELRRQGLKLQAYLMQLESQERDL